MARARNIKPGIMDNEELAQCSFEARLLFIYLWMLADREGRIEDRPPRVRVQAFPYDPGVDIDALLNELDAVGDENDGLIVRYTVTGKKYIQIANFKKHQSPHVKERASTIPAPTQHKPSTRPAPPDSLNHDSLIGDVTQKPSTRQGTGSRKKKKQRPPFRPPTVEEVRAFCREKKIDTVDPDVFVSYYATRGWYIDRRTKMKSWQDAVWNWHYRERKQGPGKHTAGARWSEQDWIAKGEQIGITARPGETTQQLIHRVRKKLETPGVA